MKKLLATLMVAVFSTAVMAAEEAPTTKKVCVTQKDSKTGKDKQTCKNVKVHKKHEGTNVDSAKKTEPAKKK